jgi:hypothetical protein
MSKKFCREL